MTSRTTEYRLVILMVGSAFMWLLSALITSIFWQIEVAASKAQTTGTLFPIIFGVFFQEVFRYLYWKLLKKAEDGLNTLGDDGSGKTSHAKQAMVAGLGFGVMSQIMQANIVINAAAGPWTMETPGGTCPGYSIFFISSVTSALFGMMNICWSTIMYMGAEQRLGSGKSLLTDWHLWLVVISHYAASFLTVGGTMTRNHQEPLGCGTSIGSLVVITIALGLTAMKVSGLKMKKA